MEGKKATQEKTETQKGGKKRRREADSAGETVRAENHLALS